MDNNYVNDFNEEVRTYFKEISKCKPLRKEEERILGRKIKRGDLNARNKLISSNLKFVVGIAKKYKGSGVSFSDLICEGNIGLAKAADKFDYRKDVKFISYAVWWIRQSIQELIKRKQESNKNEVSDEINSTIVENRIEDDEDEVIYKSDVILSDEEEETNKEITDNQRKIILKLMENLTKKEQFIINKYFGIDGKEPLTLEEIGEHLNLTKERVRQIKSKILRKMRSDILLIDNIGDIYKI